MTNSENNDDKTQIFINLVAGTKVSHYKIIDKIGVGGMGEVYLADDTQLNRKVALKFLSSTFSSDPEFRERFLREARSAGALNHPNIITIYEVSEFDNRIYIAMEFVEGLSLRKMIDDNKIDLENVYDIAIQICDGLSSAHKAGFIHRDIKPQNILMDKHGRIRILDFGLAKNENDVVLTQTGATLGTVNYMSPEQAQGQAVDYHSDIFSFGIVLFEMLTGELPFKKENMPATINAIVNEKVPPIKSSLGEISLTLKAVVEKAMEKKIEKRYSDILHLKNAIINEKYDAQLRSDEYEDITQIQRAAFKEPDVRSLAVLYLRNLGDQADEYLSYGITEDLIVDLSRIGSIRVSPMRSIMQFKDSDADFSVIGEKLKVNTVLDGSIHKSESTIRISVLLIDLENDDTLWSERWEEPFSNLPQVKKSLAEAVGALLDVNSTMVRVAQVGQPLAQDAEAYDNYLKGKYYFEHKKDKTDVERALVLYRIALEKEPGLLSASTGIAEINIYNGDFESAEKELNSALEQAKEKDLRPELANILKLLTQLHGKRSNWDKAYQFGQEALKLLKEMGDLAGEASILGILISILQPQAKYDDVFQCFDRVLEISRQQQDQDKIAEALKNMGTAYLRKGDYDRALQLYEEANEIAVEQNNFVLQAACLSNQGNVHYFRGELDDAYEHYEQSLHIAERIGDRALSARQISNMALVKLNKGEFVEGIALLQNVAESLKELGDRSNYALTLVNISQAKLTIGEVDNALDAAEEALEISRDIHNLLAESDALLCKATAYIYTDRYDDAIESCNDALSVAEKATNNRNKSLGHLLLAKTYFQSDDMNNSMKHADQSYKIAREIGERVVMLQASAYQGAVQVTQGLYNAGLRQVDESIKKLLSINNYEAFVNSKSLYGYVLAKNGKSDVDIKIGFQILDEAIKLAGENNIHIAVQSIGKLKKSLEN